MPSHAPNLGQLVLLAISVGWFLAGGGLSLLRLRDPSNRHRLAAKACVYFGILTAAIVVLWHSLQRGSWVPLEDNFDALIWLGLLLAVFVMYVQRRKPIGGLDWFILPLVVLMLLSAVLFGSLRPAGFHPANAWLWFHLASNFGGTVAFAIAAAAGVMYLVVSHRLRQKIANAAPNLGSLERLEHLAQGAMSFGFILLTLGMITGLAWMRRQSGPTTITLWSPKVVLAFSAWLVYALALHTPISPAVRGRKAAVLSIAGFVLIFAVIIAVMLMGSEAVR